MKCRTRSFVSSQLYCKNYSFYALLSDYSLYHQKDTIRSKISIQNVQPHDGNIPVLQVHYNIGCIGCKKCKNKKIVRMEIDEKIF